MFSLGIFGIFVAAVIFSTSALAYPAPTIGSKAPTHNSSSVAGNNQTPWSAVGKGAFNGQYTWYKVYVPVGTKTTVTIDQACSSSIEVGQPDVNYTLQSMESSEDSIDDSRYADARDGENPATGSCRESIAFAQINASESAPRRDSGNVSEVAGHDGRNGNQKYMVFYLRARIGSIGGGDHERSFRVSATGSALIGASSWSGVPDADGYFGIYQRDAPQLGSQRWSYELQFASDCSAGIQPTGSTQIALYDMDNGVYDPLNTVKYDIDRAPRGTDNWASWRFTSANDPGGSGNRTLLNFNYNVDYKYRLRINSVNYRNTLQMRLPFKFDQINALNSVDCTQTKEWHLTPDTKARIQAGSYNPVENSEGEWRWGPSVDAAVEAFKQARISEGVTETKGQRVESSQHNWRVEYKYIRGDTGAESSLHTKSANYNNSVSAGRTKVFTENSQVPTSASSGIRFLFGDAYEGSSSASKRTPRPNDQYCERLVNTKAEGGTVDTPSAWGCVALSGAPACLPWQVQATASMNQTQGYGDISAAWVGDRYNFNYNFWHIGLAEQTAPINFAHNETNNYLGAVSLGEWAYTSVRGPIGRESGGQSYPDSMNYQPKALNCPGGLDESHTTVLGGTITVPYYYNIKPSGQRSTGIGSTVEQGDPVSGDGSISIDESGVDIGASPSIPAIRGDASSDRSTT
ncbi:MAG: hypothetical protein ITG04_13085, partial [Proteiniphilum sp.]|nr:hypothetical protein [Proteiniphilum sp.]